MKTLKQKHKIVKALFNASCDDYNESSIRIIDNEIQLNVYDGCCNRDIVAKSVMEKGFSKLHLHVDPSQIDTKNFDFNISCKLAKYEYDVVVTRVKYDRWNMELLIDGEPLCDTYTHEREYGLDGEGIMELPFNFLLGHTLDCLEDQIDIDDCKSNDRKSNDQDIIEEKRQKLVNLLKQFTKEEKVNLIIDSDVYSDDPSINIMLEDKKANRSKTLLTVNITKDEEKLIIKS